MTMGMAPIYPFYIRNADGSYKYDSNGIQMLDYGDGKNGGMYRPFISDANPVQDSRLNTRNNEGNQFSGNAFADFYIYKGLTLTVNGTLNTDEYRTTYVYNPYYGQFDTTGGTVTKGHSRLFSWNLQQLLNYTFTVKDHNNFNFLLGHEYTNDRTYSLSASKSKMFSQDNKELDGAVQDGQSSSSSKSEYNNEGYFVRGMYDYDERIFASASFRRDASSHFAPENRWGNFWSAGAAWRICKETWFPETTWLNELKLKASVGSQGNDAIGSYMYTDLYTINNSDGNVSTSFGSKGNRDITWETNTNFNTGIEFEVFKRLSGSVEYYYRKTSDMLMRFNVPSSLGYSAFYKNVGDLYNAGVEVELNANIFKKKNFEWDANVNFSYLRNRITKLHDDVKTNSYTNASGKEYHGYTSNPFFICEDASMYTFYMREYAGVDQTTGESLWWKDVEKSEPIVDAQGQPVKDAQGNPTFKTWTEREKTNDYSSADYYITEKSTVPPFFGGFGTSLKFYGFDFSIQCSYQIGGYGYDGTYQSMMSSPTSNNTGSAFHADLLNSWSAQNKESNLPRFQFDDTYTAGTSTRFLTKASYLNIENINFGYSLPRTLLSKAQINGLRLYLQAQNVFYWSKRRGFDPRQTYSGNTDATNYSPMRTISAGVKLTF
jgi:TonB-linked SusC/RagA family outer membrane protein